MVNSAFSSWPEGVSSAWGRVIVASGGDAAAFPNSYIWRLPAGRQVPGTQGDTIPKGEVTRPVNAPPNVVLFGRTPRDWKENQ